MYRYIIIFLSFLFCFNLHALVKVENVKQGVAGQGKGLVRISLSNATDLSKVSLNYADDFVEIIIPEAFIIPASKKVFNPSSSKSSVLRIEAEMLKGTKVSVKIFYRLAIDIVKSRAELKQENKDIVFYYSTVKAEKPSVIEDKVLILATQQDEKSEIKEPKTESIKNTQTNSSETSNLFINHNKSETKKEGISLFWSFVKMLMVLIFIIAIFLISVYFFKKYFKGSFALYGKKLVDPNIKILGSLSLEFAKTIYIVKIAEEKHLIACSKDRVTYLSKLADDTNIDNTLLEDLNHSGSFKSTHNSTDTLKTRLKDRLREKK